MLLSMGGAPVGPPEEGTSESSFCPLCREAWNKCAGLLPWLEPGERGDPGVCSGLLVSTFVDVSREDSSVPLRKTKGPLM